MKKKDYKERIQFIKEKCSYIRAEFEHSFYNKNHLDSFWYNGEGVAEIRYKGHTVRFDVCGDVSAVFYKRGKFKAVFSRKEGDAPFFENEDCRKAIRSDKVLLNDEKVDFDYRNKISVIVVNNSGDFYENPKILDEHNLLESVENHFNYYIEYIDNLVGGTKNEIY